MLVYKINFNRKKLMELAEFQVKKDLLIMDQKYRKGTNHKWSIHTVFFRLVHLYQSLGTRT